MLIKQDFYFNSLGAVRPLHIRVSDHGEPPYPVCYFFDGHNLFRDEDATYGKSWGFDEFCRDWDKQVIIVGIECAHENGKRLSEYLPYGTGFGWLKGIEPLGDATMQGLIYELKPYIDSTFPTIPFRECTAIGGSSMGGLMAAYGLPYLCPESSPSTRWKVKRFLQNNSIYIEFQSLRPSSPDYLAKTNLSYASSILALSRK